LSQDTIEQLRRQLAALHPQSLVITDQSHHHAGHAGAGDGGHYELTIVADIFTGKSMIARHRLIYDIVEDLMHGKIHALALHARTPGEV
jgi:BolA family transcriptional regulator, general stress-responsive regulator